MANVPTLAMATMIRLKFRSHAEGFLENCTCEYQSVHFCSEAPFVASAAAECAADRLSSRRRPSIFWGGSPHETEPNLRPIVCRDTTLLGSLRQGLLLRRQPRCLELREQRRDRHHQDFQIQPE